MASAAEAYDLFLLNYPRSRYRERVLLRLIDANLASFKGPEYDPTGVIDAMQRIKQYRQEFPAAAERMGADALLVRLEESLALSDFYTAQWYDRQNREVSAAYMYRRVIKDHPTTSAAQKAADRLLAMGRQVGDPENAQ
jgi:outer membrane protein assembly factor BamD (BamD/ComL family)